jgi:ABC-type sugar transport system substrate-binding protein
MAFSQNSDLNIRFRINYSGNSSVGDFIIANPAVKTIVGVDGFAWFVGRAIGSQGKSGEIIGGGIDVIECILEETKKGNLQVAAGQGGYSQGYTSRQPGVHDARHSA